jgi:hypothetical protein
MRLRPPTGTQGPLARGMFAVAVLVSLAVLFAPANDVPSAPPGVDKLVHSLLFAVLALTGRWAGIARGVLAALLVAYAALSEVLQGLPVLGRSSSIADWVADVVGVLLGMAVWSGLSRRRVAR